VVCTGDAAGGEVRPIRCTDNTGRVILRLEVIRSGGQPILGLVWDGDGLAHAFSGWSEIFAVLHTLTSSPGDGTEMEDGT
jgi:hypothetical protein